MIALEKLGEQEVAMREDAMEKDQPIRQKNHAVRVNPHLYIP